MSRNRALFIPMRILLAFSLLLCVSCTGKREVNDLAMVMAVGIDKDPETERIQVIAQIVRPADARGQTGAPSGGTGQPIWTAGAQGESIFSAMRNLARYSSRRVFWAHNKVIIISEKVARDGITDVVDFFTRNHELRMTTWIVVTPDNASEIVATQTGMEVIPGDSIDKLFRYSQIVSEAPRSDIRTVLSDYLSETSNPVMALIQTRSREISMSGDQFGEKKQIELSGAAVFHKGKMVGKLSAVESRGLLWFVESVDSGVLPLECEDKPVSLELKNSSFSVKPGYAKNKVHFDITLDTELDLVELGCPTHKSNREIMKELEKKAEKQFAKEIRHTMWLAQKKYKVDFLDLGKTFQNKYPKVWKSIKKEWPDYMADADYTLKVHAHLRSPVLLQQPTSPKEEYK